MGTRAKAFLWSGLDYFSVQMIQFVLSIIIARLVAPAAYGIVVMVQVFISFAQLFIDGGFKTALIQKKDRTEIDYYTIFIFNMAVAAFLYFILFVTAPLIADFYNEQQLTNLTRAIGLNLIFSSLSITQLVRLQTSLNFKTQAKARLVSVTVSGIIGVCCAYRGMGAWALVIQGLVNSLLTSLMLMFFSRWVPKLRFSIVSFKQLFGLGAKLLFANFLTNCYIQLTNLFIGKFYSPVDLAYYDKGFHISQLPASSLMEIINRTVFPILSSLQNDMKALLTAYRKYMRLSCLVIFPLIALVGVLAHPLVIVLLTEKWEGATELLSLFCIAFSLYPMICNPGNIITVLGYGNLIVKGAIIKKCVEFCILIISLFISVKAVAIGLILCNIFEGYINMRYCKLCTGVTILHQIGYIKNITIITVLTAIVAYFVKSLFNNIYLQLFVAGFAGFFFFAVSIFVFKLEERDLIKSYFIKLKKRIHRE